MVSHLNCVVSNYYLSDKPIGLEKALVLGDKKKGRNTYTHLLVSSRTGCVVYTEVEKK